MRSQLQTQLRPATKLRSNETAKEHLREMTLRVHKNDSGCPIYSIVMETTAIAGTVPHSKTPRSLRSHVATGGSIGWALDCSEGWYILRERVVQRRVSGGWSSGWGGRW